MEQGVIFGLLAMVSFGLTGAISQRPVRLIGNHKSIFYRGLFAVPLLIVLVFLLSKSTVTIGGIALAFGIGVFGYIPLASFFKALEYGKVGAVAPITSSSVLVTTLLAVIFLGEQLSSNQILAVVLIILGNVFISINFKDFRNSDIFKIKSGMPNAFLTFLLWGVVFFLFRFAVDSVGPYFTTLLVEVANLVMAFIFLKIKGIEIHTDKKPLIYLLIAGVFIAIAGTSYNVGVDSSPVSLVAPLALSNALVSTIYGAIVYKERLRPLQYTAVLTIIAGIVLISAG